MVLCSQLKMSHHSVYYIYTRYIIITRKYHEAVGEHVYTCEVQIIQKFSAGRVITQLTTRNDNSADTVVHCYRTCIETSNTTPYPYGNFLTVDSSWQNWGARDTSLNVTLENILQRYKTVQKKRNDSRILSCHLQKKIKQNKISK